MNYRDRFNKMRTELLAVGTDIANEDTGVGITAGMRKYYRDDEGFSVPDDVFDLYESFDGLEMFWLLENEGNNLDGFFGINCWKNLLENKIENELYADWYGSDDITEIEKHRIFESINGADAYVTIVFDEGNDYQLYCMPEGSVNFGGSKMLTKIPLTIDQYIEIIFGYYGSYSVRHHLHKPEFYENPAIFIPQYALLQQRFPHFNPPKINPNFSND